MKKNKPTIKINLLPKLAILAAMIFAAPAIVSAAPANPHPMDVTQANGREITIFHRGDEFFAWFEDEAGNVIVFDQASNNWRYARVTDGSIVPSPHDVGGGAVGATPIRRDVILPLIEAAWRFCNATGGPDGLVWTPETAGAGAQISLPGEGDDQPGGGVPPTGNQPGGNQPGGPGEGPVGPGSGQPGIPAPPTDGGPGGGGPAGPVGPIGFRAPWHGPASPMSTPQAPVNQNLIVLLIEFADQRLVQNEAFYAAQYFGRGAGDVSVVNFFRDMSGGRDVFIAPNTSMIGSVTHDGMTVHPSTHNGIVRVTFDQNHPISSWVPGEGHMAMQALVARAMAAINTTAFDAASFGDNFHVAAVIAGGEASDAYNPGAQVWAHAWQFDGASIGRPGTWPRYMVYGERMRGGNVMGIGIAVHELGHLLGLPDLYDISGQSEGAGPYSIMAHGGWGAAPGGHPGSRPTAMDPFSRMQLGFITPQVVNTGTWQGNVNTIGSNENIILVTSPVDPNQFFLIENRQTTTTWDAGLDQWIGSGGGIMVHHVDQSQFSPDPGDMRRNNNNRFHRMVSVHEADGSGALATSNVNWRAVNDHFFSAGGFTEFGPNTNPTSHFFDGSGTAAGRSRATGIEMQVLSPRGASMEVVISLPEGATGPGAPGRVVTGILGAAGVAARVDMPAQMPFAPLLNTLRPGATIASSATANHTSITNQLTGANVAGVALNLPVGISSQINIFVETARNLANTQTDLLIFGNSISAVLPHALLNELAQGRTATEEISINLVGGHIAGSNLFGGGSLTIAVNDQNITQTTTPYFIVIELNYHHLANQHRITAIHNSQNIGGRLDADSGAFYFFSNNTGAFTVGYVENLQRLSLQTGSLSINDLAAGRTVAMDVAPVIINGRTLVPVSFLIDALGGTTDWDPVTQTVTIFLGSQSVAMTIGQLSPGMDVAPVLMNDRTMVPLRFVVESLGAAVHFDEASGIVDIVR